MSFGKWLFEHTVVPVVGGAGMLSAEVKYFVWLANYRARSAVRRAIHGYDADWRWYATEEEIAWIMEQCGGTYSDAAYNSITQEDWRAIYLALKGVPSEQWYSVGYLEISKLLAAKGFIPKPFDHPPQVTFTDDDEEEEVPAA